MQLNTQQFTGQAPITKNYLAPNVSGAEFETPVLEVLIHIRYHFQCPGLMGETDKKLTTSYFKQQVQITTAEEKRSR